MIAMKIAQQAVRRDEAEVYPVVLRRLREPLETAIELAAERKHRGNVVGPRLAVLLYDEVAMGGEAESWRFSGTFSAARNAWPIRSVAIVRR